MSIQPRAQACLDWRCFGLVWGRAKGASRLLLAAAPRLLLAYSHHDERLKKASSDGLACASL